MSTGRYVILGLSNPRTPWFRSLSQWANAAALPIELVKCISPEELRARLGSGRPFSAVIVDGAMPSVDRDLIATATDAGCPVLVVDDPRVERDWRQLGVATTLPVDFDRAHLLDTLSTFARMISRAEHHAAGPAQPPAAPPWKGALIAVIGPGGSGTSSVATGVAQALAGDVRYGRSVLLADLCRNAEQAMLHDTGSLTPGLQELVEAHRSGQLAAADVRALTFPVPRRGYDLLLGLRRARFWPTLRPAAFAAALGSLVNAYQAVVADLDGDVEGEQEGGSIDVEERNVATRTVLGDADAVLAIGSTSLKGLHSLTRLLAEIGEAGVPSPKVVPVLNWAPRSPRQRATYAAALADLTPWRDEQAGVAGAPGAPNPVFVPVRAIDSAFRDGAPLPDAFVSPLLGAVRHVLRPQAAPSTSGRRGLLRVVPGSLARWGEALEGEPEVSG